MLFIYGSICDQLPPLALIMYRPCPIPSNAKSKPFCWTIFLWHNPNPIQLPVDLEIRKVIYFDYSEIPLSYIGLSRRQHLHLVGSHPKT